ncbi:UNVERIFIED_CONTAM: hypothetical protein GTU68_025514 [Idotea baltica]|nr:hypothetical protein [Idotea baltica]
MLLLERIVLSILMLVFTMMLSLVIMSLFMQEQF